MKLKVLVALLVAVLLVGGGAFALTRLLAPAEDDAIAFAPADSLFYANVFVRPSNEQKRSFDALVRKFPGVESGEDLIQKIVDALEEDLEESGVNYEEDIEPWLGDQVALFASPGATPGEPAVAILIESKNDGAAQDFIESAAEEDGVELESRSYKGEDYRFDPSGPDPVGALVLDGFLVFGTDDGIKDAIDTSQGETESLEDDETFVNTTDPLRDDWMGLFYFDFAATVEEYLETGEATAEERQAVEVLRFGDQPPIAAVLYATENSAVFEVSAERGSGLDAIAEAGDGGLLPGLPGGSWGALGIGQVGETVSGYFEALATIPGFDREQVDALFYGETGLRLEQDVLSWMGDAGLFVQGTNFTDIGGGLVVESSDPAKTSRLVEKVESLIAAQGLGPKPESIGGLEGFSIALPGAPAPVNVLGGDRLVIAYGDEASEAVTGDGPTLEDSDAFQAAQQAVGDDFDIGFYFDVDGAQKFGEAVASFTGAPMDEYEKDYKPWIDVFTHVVYASKQEGDTTVQKFLIGVE